LVHGGDGAGEFEMTSQFVVMDGGAGSGDDTSTKVETQQPRAIVAVRR
jgi:hypothetical protein